MSILVGVAVGVILTILDLLAFGFGVGGAIALLHLLVAPGLGLGLFCWGIRKRQAKMRRVGLALLLSAVAAFAVSTMLRNRKIAHSKAVGDAVCMALESCRQSVGRYPQRLQELVPAFLSAVPGTSMGVFRSLPFDYLPEPGGDDYALGFSSTFFLYCARGREANWRCDD
jgi:4-amino-4-deoxy-L-arabinose transferase-like glycosyltransferase